MPENFQGLADQWFVTNGLVALGPLEFGRLTRGVAQGHVAPTSFVRHHSWKVWRELAEIEGLSTVDRHEAVRRLAGISSVADARAADPSSRPPPPLDVAPDSRDGRADSHPSRSSVRPSAIDPVGVLSSARDLESALLLALSTAIAAANADLGLLHRHREELGAVVATYAQGPNAETLLGMRLAPDDPSVLAARAGRTVIGEPLLGDAGRYIAGRLAPCLSALRGVAMVPVVIYGDLVALIEIGRAEGPFRAREIGRIEDVVEALVGRIVVQGWR
jgi:hypothetical protein